MNKHRKTPVKLEELKVRGVELLFKQLSLRANTTLNATMILFLSFHVLFFDPPFLRGLSYYIVSFLHYPDRTLVHYLSLHSSICPIIYLLWLSANGGGWNCTVQRSFPHKCGQKSCCSAFNAVVVAFASRYFCIFIIFACAWSSSLSLGSPGGSPRWPKYLLNWYSLYSRSLGSSDYIPSSFLYAILHSEHLLPIYSFSNVSMLRNRAQGPLYRFGLLPPQGQNARFFFWKGHLPIFSQQITSNKIHTASAFLAHFQGYNKIHENEWFFGKIFPQNESFFKLHVTMNQLEC